MVFMDKKQVAKDIEKLRENKNCAQATAIGICKNSDVEVDLDELNNLTAVFGGGIGGTFDEGTCGALTGCAIAMRFVEETPEKRPAIMKEVFKNFKDKYSTVTCGGISKNGKDKSPCVECCVYVGEIVSDLLD